MLTTLTILLILLLFVAAPLHAAGMIHARAYGTGIALVLAAGVFIMSGSVLAVIAMLVAIGLTITATLLPFTEVQPLISISRLRPGSRNRIRTDLGCCPRGLRAWARYVPSHHRCHPALSDDRSGVSRIVHVGRPARCGVIFRRSYRMKPRLLASSSTSVLLR